MLLAVTIGLSVGVGSRSIGSAILSGAIAEVALVTVAWLGRTLFPDLWLREARRALFAPTKRQLRDGVLWVARAEHFLQPRADGKVHGQLMVESGCLCFVPGRAQPDRPARVAPLTVSLDSVVSIEACDVPRGYDYLRRRLRVEISDGRHELFGVEGGADAAAASLHGLLGQSGE